MNSLMAVTARTLTAAGLELPAAAATCLAVDEAATEAANVAPTADLAALIATGEMTPENVGPAVTEAAGKLAAQQYAAQVVRDLDGPLRTAFNAALRADAPRLLKTLRRPFDQAAAVVHAAAEHFAPGASAEDVLAGGAAAAAAHEQLAAALGTLGRIRGARVALAEICGEGEQDPSWWIANAADDAELDRARWAWAQPGDPFHALAYAGFRLRLNTATEAASVTSQAAAVTAEHEAAEQARLVAEITDGWPAFPTAPAGTAA